VHPGLLICGGANSAVDEFGDVMAWLADHGKGANLPSASQSLYSIEKRRAAYLDT
jgi:hypothetical protein